MTESWSQHVLCCQADDGIRATQLYICVKPQNWRQNWSSYFQWLLSTSINPSFPSRVHLHCWMEGSSSIFCTNEWHFCGDTKSNPNAAPLTSALTANVNSSLFVRASFRQLTGVVSVVHRKQNKECIVSVKRSRSCSESRMIRIH